MQSVLDKVKLFLFDMDGTVYVGPRAIEGAFEAVEFIKSKGRRICYLTNNSSLPTLKYIDKLARYGVSISRDEIYSSTVATIEYLKMHYPDKRVYAVATEAVRAELMDGGIHLVEDAPEVVLLTFDKELTFDKLTKLCNALFDGAAYIATHPDMVCPFEPHPLPDIGSFFNLIEGTTGRRPDVICGKPYAAMAESVMHTFGLKPEEIAMVGDRLYTDIQFGLNNGFVSILVMTGETDAQMLREYPQSPTLTLDTLADIISYIS